jgi:magnesium transporter
VNEADQLLGVIDIKQLFMAEDDVLLSNLMVENIISLNPDSTMKQAADAFIRYGFRALPVTDDNDIILDVVPYRDVMNLKHRILDQTRTYPRRRFIFRRRGALSAEPGRSGVDFRASWQLG